LDGRGSSEVIRLFPSFVLKTRLGSEARAAVRAAILDEVAVERAGAADPQAGQVWQSRHGLHRLPALEPLVQHVRAGVGLVLEFLRVESAPLEITGLWVNVAAPGGAVRLHAHPNNFLSGVYYVQVQEGADSINFHDPRPQAGVVRPPVTELTAYNTDLVVVRIEEGDLLVFPSWLLHSVDPNQSDRIRISASFNAMFSTYAETIGGPLWGER
jgi:uncharacterized protein (TIGR02466 family)